DVLKSIKFTGELEKEGVKVGGEIGFEHIVDGSRERDLNQNEKVLDRFVGDFTDRLNSMSPDQKAIFKREMGDDIPPLDVKPPASAKLHRKECAQADQWTNAKTATKRADDPEPDGRSGRWRRHGCRLCCQVSRRWAQGRRHQDARGRGARGPAGQEPAARPRA